MSDQPPDQFTQTTAVHNVQLETFEKAVYAHDYEEASKLLLDSLRKLKAGAAFIGYPTTLEAMVPLYTRYCAAVFALLADPQYVLTQEGFDAVAGENAIIDLLFRCSVFGTSDHMLPQFAADPTEKDTNKIKFKDSVGLLKYLITYSLRSGFRMNFEKAFADNPQLTFALYIGMLTTMLATSKDAHARREELLGLHTLFSGVNLSDRFLSPMSDAYMYCSYATRQDKHALKRTIHSLYAKMMADNGFHESKFDKRKAREKPVVLVPVEWFTSLHAMYRCYAPLIRQLRTKFKVVGMGRPHSVDDLSKKEFDGWYEIPEERIILSKVVAHIKTINPDVIYYPSIGMDLVWVALSSIRLAPVQVMTLGHPASSQSPAIDYVITEDGDIGDPALFSETIVPLPRGSLFRFVMRPDAELPIPFTEAHPAVLRLAVPAMVLKLSAPFMETLREIASKAEERGHKVEFHFWPNMIGTVLHQTAKELREWLPNALIYERSQYNEYMRQLQRCHIQLGTFPFGGTNSNIDSMLLGLPLVCMEGMEPHERFDATMQRRAGTPEWLIAHTKEEYVDAALRLIENGDERVAISQYLTEHADVAGKFLSEPSAEFSTAFVDAMWSLYEGSHHHAAK